MKIGFLCPSIAECGGVQRITVVLANALVVQHKVSVISINNERRSSYFPLDSKIEQFFYNDFKFKRTDLASGIIRKIERKHPFILPSRLAQRAYFPKYICQDLGKFLSELNLDCIIGVTGHCAILLGAMRRYLGEARLVGWMHNSYNVHYEVKGKGFFTQINFVKKVYKNLNEIVTLTNSDAAQYRKKMGLECKYIYNPLSFCCVHKTAGTNKKLLFVGRLDVEHKGLDFLIEIMRKLVYERGYNDWQLQIVGEGPGRKSLEKWIKDAKLEENVELVGEKEEVIPYYCGASIFLCTSRWEGFGLVVTEAMECGLPVVSFQTDGPMEILNNEENGYIISNYDLEAFADATERLMINDEFRKKFSVKASERALDFHLDTIVDKWEKILKGDKIIQ